MKSRKTRYLHFPSAEDLVSSTRLARYYLMNNLILTWR